MQREKNALTMAAKVTANLESSDSSLAGGTVSSSRARHSTLFAAHTSVQQLQKRVRERSANHEAKYRKCKVCADVHRTHHLLRDGFGTHDNTKHKVFNK
jgi:hypothetical protein